MRAAARCPRVEAAARRRRRHRYWSPPGQTATATAAARPAPAIPPRSRRRTRSAGRRGRRRAAAGAGRPSAGSAAGTADPPCRSRQQARCYREPTVEVTVLSLSTGQVRQNRPGLAWLPVQTRLCYILTSGRLFAVQMAMSENTDCGCIANEMTSRNHFFSFMHPTRRSARSPMCTP